MTTKKKKIFPQTVFIVLIFAFLVIFWATLKGSITIPPYISLFGFELRFYGLIIGLAALTVVTLVEHHAAKEEAKIWEKSWVVIFLCAIVGARAWHVWTDFDYYQDSLVDALMIWNGGLSIFGGILGGILGLFISLKIHNRLANFLKFLEQLIIFIPVGQIVGRFGNFINQEIYGIPTNLPWGMYVRPENRVSEHLTSEYFHPSFLYEIIGNVILFSILYYISKKYGVKGNGKIVSIYLIGYGIVRSIVNLFRIDREFVTSVSMATSLGMVGLGLLLGIGVWVRLKRRG